MFRADFFHDEDFIGGVGQHSERLAQLQQWGIAGSYTALVSLYEATVLSRLLEIGNEYRYARVEITFLPNSLLKPVVLVTETNSRDFPEEETSPGRILFYLNLHWLFEQRPNSRSYEADLESLLRKRAIYFLSDFHYRLNQIVFDSD
jgi:hypothetical protein